MSSISLPKCTLPYLKPTAGTARVSRRIISGLRSACLRFAEFAEPCRTPAELFWGSLTMGKNCFVLLST